MFGRLPLSFTPYQCANLWDNTLPSVSQRRKKNQGRGPAASVGEVVMSAVQSPVSGIDSEDFRWSRWVGGIDGWCARKDEVIVEEGGGRDVNVMAR